MSERAHGERRMLIMNEIHGRIGMGMMFFRRRWNGRNGKKGKGYKWKREEEVKEVN